jgi:hypothetical protein
MPVTRIYVRVEIVDDDGEVTIHTADGTPARGTVVASIVPHHRSRLHRRAGFVESEVVEVGVRLEATLLPGDNGPLFRASTTDTTAPPIDTISNVVLMLTEEGR